MKVTIRDIRPQESVSVPGTTRLGYPVEFTTPTVSGFATIVPGPGGSRNLAPGRSLEVDARHEYVSRFRLFGEPVTAAMEPLEARGDYVVRGPVIFAFEDGSFGVEAGGFIFTLTRHEALGQLPAKGQCVSFHLHGLSLWDRASAGGSDR